MSLLISSSGRRLLAREFFVTCQKRTNIRESIHRHTEPSKFKKHMLSACEPYFKKDYRPMEELCRGTKPKLVELHPLEVILAKELVQDIEESDFILILQYNYTPFQSDRVYKNKLTHSGGKFQAFNNNIYKEAFTNLKLDDSAINLFNYTRHSLVTGKMDSLPKCVQVLKKIPHYILLCGLVDRRLYTVDMVNSMCSCVDIAQSRANLVAILETPAIVLSGYIEQHSESLKPEETGTSS